jgi:hypothetical protein
MRHHHTIAIAVALLTAGFAARAQDHDRMDHSMHMATMSADARQPVVFPPAMRQHMLGNMRDHLQALADILAALSGGDYANAAHIAHARLGMASPTAASCNPAGGGATGAPEAMDMEQMMARFMPESMRAVGLEMHQSASVFAAEADKAAGTGDARPAYAALARVTEKCAACHMTYRVQ